MSASSSSSEASDWDRKSLSSCIRSSSPSLASYNHCRNSVRSRSLRSKDDTVASVSDQKKKAYPDRRVSPRIRPKYSGSARSR